MRNNGKGAKRVGTYLVVNSKSRGGESESRSSNGETHCGWRRQRKRRNARHEGGTSTKRWKRRTR